MGFKQMKICPNCGNQNPDDVNFCENCGTKLTETQKQCPRCKAMAPDDSRFCENCGYDFDATKVSNPRTISAADDPKLNKGEQSSNEAKDTQKAPETMIAEDSVKSNDQPVKASAIRQQTSKKNGAKWQWGISLLILVLLIGGAAYLLHGHSNKSTASSSSHVEKKHSTKARSSSSSRVASSRTSQSVSFDKSQIEGDITATIGSISGTNSVYVSPVDSKQTVLVNNGSQSSASSIKVFILVTAYAMAKENIFNLNDTHTITDDEKVGGTGVIQNMSEGTKLTYREILEHMIDDSDNTAANIIIDKLGGFSLINTKIKSLGATDTKLRRKMMDTEAIKEGHDNTTSANDLGTTLKKLYNHQLVSKKADDEMLAILAKNQNRTKLPKRLPSEATVYNKTGEFSDYGVQNDAEIVKNSRGAFVAVVLSEDGEEADQVQAMNQLGLNLYQNILE